MTEEVHSEERFLVFMLGDLRFAMSLLSAKEVTAPKKTTLIPSANRIITGVLNLRGRIVTVVDLKAKLEISSQNKSPEASLIILDDDFYSYGIMVDDIETVLSIKKDQIEPLEDSIGISRNIHTKKFAKVDGKIILILDIEELVADLSHRSKEITSSLKAI